MSNRDGETIYRKPEKKQPPKPRGRPRKAKSVEPPTTLGEPSFSLPSASSLTSPSASSSASPTGKHELSREVRKKMG